MEKRKDAQIYIAFHKPIDYGLWNNSLYTPVEAGAALRPVVYEGLHRDNEGVNISEWNGLYAETTVLYWIYNNVLNKEDHPKYVGFCQYRRRLEFPEDQDFDELFKDRDVITMTPIRVGFSVQDFYGRAHCKDDIDRAERIVRELYPDLAGQWDRIMKLSPEMLYSNGFIMRTEDYCRYYEFLFSVFDCFKQERGWDTPEKAYADVEEEIKKGRRRPTKGVKYQAQIGGFLSERLWTFYCFATYPRERILFKDYLKFEGC